MVTLWVGGFDVFYALQDEAFDRAEGLHSAVVRFGAERSILLAKLAHGFAVLALVGFGAAAGFHWPFYAAVVVGAAIIGWEHQLVRAGDLSRLNAAFFTMNGVVSITVLSGCVGGSRDMKKRSREWGVVPVAGKTGSGRRERGTHFPDSDHSPLPTPRTSPPSPPRHPKRSPTPNRRGR